MVTAKELDSDTLVEAVIASVKQVPLPAGSTTCVEKLSALLWELMSNKKKKKCQGGCSSWWASAGPWATCCWPLFCQMTASSMRGPSCVSWRSLCELNRCSLKEDTSGENSNLSCRLSDWLTEQTGWLTGNIWWGQSLKKRHLPLHHHHGWCAPKGFRFENRLYRCTIGFFSDVLHICFLWKHLNQNGKTT